MNSPVTRQSLLGSRCNSAGNVSTLQEEQNRGNGKMRLLMKCQKFLTLYPRSVFPEITGFPTFSSHYILTLSEHSFTKTTNEVFVWKPKCFSCCSRPKMLSSLVEVFFNFITNFWEKMQAFDTNFSQEGKPRAHGYCQGVIRHTFYNC